MPLYDEIKIASLLSILVWREAVSCSSTRSRTTSDFT